MGKYVFDSANFEEKWFDNGTVVFYFEKNKDEEFSAFLKHSKKGQRTFYRYTDIKNFLAEEGNESIRIYITIGEEEVKPFMKVDEGLFLIDLESYVNFQKTIRTGGSMRAFLTQTFNIHSANEDQINLLVAQNTKEENIIEIIRKLPPEKQAILLQSLQTEFGKGGSFDLKSDAEGVFLQICDIDNREIVIEQLKKLEQNNFANIESAFSISKIEQVLEVWERNKDNDSEEFWQKTFESHNWILSQVFSTPMIFIKGKPYCGGKSPENSGGVMSDLWYKNMLTEITVFIEIKTPKSKLIGTKYRGKEEGENNVIYGMSNELTGGIIQVSNQREVAISEFGKSGEYKIHNAKSLLIIGKIPEDEDQSKSFSLFRNSNKDVEIITFDELFKKIELLRKIYE